MNFKFILDPDFNRAIPSSLETEFQHVVRQRGCSQSVSTAAQEVSLPDRRLGEILQQVSRYLIDFLTGQSALSIRVQQRATGELEWIVYDPATSTRLSFFSERALRAWLETKHYQSATR